MNTEKKLHKLAAIVTCASMLLGCLPAAFASSDQKLCEHHTHSGECTSLTAECAYVCTVCTAQVQSMINALVPMTSVTNANKASVKASLSAIDEKMAALTTEAVKSLNLTKYNEVSYVCNAPDSMAIGKITNQFASLAGVAPEMQFSFVDQSGTNAVLSYASNLQTTDKISVGQSGTSEYFYLPKGKYTLKENTDGSWHVDMTVGGKSADNVTVNAGDVFSINTVSTQLKTITKINTVFQDTFLPEYKAAAPSVISGLASTVNVTLEGGAAVDLPTVWVCERYNAAPDAKNTFSWSVPESALTKKYDATSVVLSGSIQVTNAPAIAVLNSGSDAAFVYDKSKFDVSNMFVRDINGGADSYEITGGTGTGTLSGTLLEIQKAGTFDVKLTTSANGAYGAGEMTAVLTVSKAQGTGSVSADDFCYGTTSWAPVVQSETNGIENVTFFYKTKDSDDSSYTQSVPSQIGTYTVKAVFAANDLYEEVSATDDFEIKKSELKVNPEDEPSSKRSRKRSTLSAITIIPGEILNAEGKAVEGTYAWNEPDKVILKDGFEKATFTPSDPNYAPLEIEIEVDVYTAYDNSSMSGSTTVFTVYFYTDDEEIADIERVQYGKKLSEPADPVKEGYDFVGWYTDSRFKNEYDFDTKVTESFSLIAKWVKSDDEADEDNSEFGDECRGTPSDECPSCEFDDLDTDEWYHEGTDYALENGIMNGTGKNTFEPDSELTRAMLVTILYRAEGEPEIKVHSGFTDVSSGSWYSKAVAWAKVNKIVNGNNAYSFAPEDNITREDFATIIYRYSVYKGYDVSVGENTNILSYEDFYEISNYAVSAFQYVAGAGIMSGKSESTLNPGDNATRAEAATILFRLNTVVNEK